MERYITGYDGQRNPIYAEELTVEEMVQALKKSSEWAVFRDKFDMGKSSNNTLFGMLIDQKLVDDFSIDDCKRLLQVVLSAGGIVTLDGTTYEFELREPEPELAPEPEVPRDKNGNPLNPAQIAWRNFAIWANDPNTSSEMIRQRRSTDRSFAEFYRHSLTREAQETPSTQFSIAGQATTDNKPAVTPELVAFAEAYRHTSTEEVRKLRSPLINPLGWERYKELESAAASAGFLGR
jgi:hypothetical protein